MGLSPKDRFYDRVGLNGIMLQNLAPLAFANAFLAVFQKRAEKELNQSALAGLDFHQAYPRWGQTAILRSLLSLL